MGNLDGFDASTIDPTPQYQPLPEGDYVVRIVASEMKATKAGTGRYLELKMEVCDGRQQGRNLWARLNLDNPNVEAVEIARRELSQICHAVGIMKPRDSAELHNLPFVATVKVKARKDTGDLTNEIAGYARYAGAPVAAPEPAKPPAFPAVPKAAGGAAPWARQQ